MLQHSPSDGLGGIGSGHVSRGHRTVPQSIGISEAKSNQTSYDSLFSTNTIILYQHTLTYLATFSQGLEIVFISITSSVNE